MTDLVRGILIERQRLGRETYVFPAESASGHLAEPKFALEQVAEACGIRISAHDLRRTYATVANRSGVSPGASQILASMVSFYCAKMRSVATSASQSLSKEGRT